jgi:pimeloyl-ACP methyl ester carboxylesterase
MGYDASSFDSFLRSLNLTRNDVTDRTGRGMMSLVPVPVFDLALRLGLGQFIIDTEQNRSIAKNMGVPPQMLSLVGRRMRDRSMWREAWEELAASTMNEIDPSIARGDRSLASQQIQLAIILLGLAYGGDGDYIHTSMRERQHKSPIFQKLYHQLRQVKDEIVEQLEVTHARGVTVGLLHLPKHGTPPFPALLALHPMAGDKDHFDFSLGAFREAGYATFTIDMPAHGDSFNGARAQPDDERIFAEVLEALAAAPKIDPNRLGVIGGSFGAFFALRTAAFSSSVKVCVAYSSPFDIGHGLPDAVRGIQDHFAWVVGASTFEESLKKAKPFHLKDVIEKIKCPICLVHGTRDHICDFTVPYEIARRAKAPLDIYPLVGADHEASAPSMPHVARPAVEWLKKTL